MPRGLRHLVAALQRANAGSALIVATLVGMALLALFSWRQLTRAVAARRSAADAAITEYAAYSARMFAEGAYRRLEAVQVRVLLPVLVRRAGALPSLDAFRRSGEMELRRLGLGEAPGVGFFIANLDANEVRGSGAATSPGTQRSLLTAIRLAPPPNDIRVTPTRWADLDAVPLTALYAGAADGPAARPLVYGFTIDRAALWRSIGDGVMTQLPLLPATFVDPEWRYLTDPQRMDTLVAIAAHDAAGRVLYRSRAEFAPRLSGEFNALNGPAAFRVTATLHPDMEALLRESTRQAAAVGAPVPTMLPVVSLLLVLVAAAQFRRQRSMARARRTFVGAVSHELRTPLAQIRLYTETLQLGRAGSADERLRWLDIVSREAHKLGGIVDNILLFSNLDAGRARLEKEPTDLGELIEEVVESFVPLAKQREMRIFADAPSRIVAMVDPRAMRQVVGNLLDNALKYGAPRQTVTIELDRVGAAARLTVCDQGPGIPESGRRRIWRPFHTVRVGDGTGIGLAVVRGLVRQHAGRVDVVAGPEGRGACFVVELPALPAGSVAQPVTVIATRRPRHIDAAAWGLTSVLLAITALSLGAAWYLRSSWVAQQEATDQAIREYAAFSARQFYDRSFGVFESLRYRALAPAVAPDAGSAVSLEDVAATGRSALARIGMSPSPATTGFFRLDRHTGAYEGIDVARDSGLRAPIAAAITEAETLAVAPNEPVRLMALLDRQPALSIGYVMRAPAGDAEGVAWGFVASRTHIWEAAGNTVLRELMLLPPSLIDPEWRWLVDPAGSDSIVAITLADAEGRVVYRSREPFADSPVGEFDTRNIPGGVLMSATLHPTLVQQLRERFNAPQRAVTHLALAGISLRMDVLIAVLSLLLVSAIIFQLKREQSLLRARRDFIASVSHELRTPLAQMRMFTETLLLGRERDAEERGRWLDVVSRESRRLGDLVENILLFSHLGADATQLEKERTDLGELVEEIVEAYLPVSLQRDARIVADAPTGIFVMVDPRAMRQVVVNLLDNALKYGPKGQVVRIDLEQSGHTARLTVTDQGPGIAREDRRRIWEPFVRLGRYAGTTGGSGIGLSVVRGLVERHGGSIQVDDAPGGGARFIVELETSLSAEGLPLRATGEWNVRSTSGTK
jgi:two-component system, OmpR family, phosphate regulon sensor histidine kinase PhoR